MIDRSQPVPSPVYLAPPVRCAHCRMEMMVTPVSPGSRRYLVEHPSASYAWIESGMEIDWCPFNNQRWVLEYDYRLWPVDPATGGIDTFSGRVV